jgi:hypothetical protein
MTNAEGSSKKRPNAEGSNTVEKVEPSGRIAFEIRFVIPLDAFLAESFRHGVVP